MFTNTVFYLLNLLSPSKEIFTSDFCFMFRVLFGSFLSFPLLFPLLQFFLYIHIYILRAVLKYLSEKSIISHFRAYFHWMIFLLLIAHMFSASLYVDSFFHIYCDRSGFCCLLSKNVEFCFSRQLIYLRFSWILSRLVFMLC